MARWRQFQRITIPRSPFKNLVRKRGATWLAPRLVAGITFQEWMEGFLRHPCFVGLRGDKPPKECLSRS